MIQNYIADFDIQFPECAQQRPWHIVRDVVQLIQNKIGTLSKDYKINGDIAIHKNAIVEPHVTFKGPIIISEGCFVGANAYLRGGVFLGPRVSIGPGCELKSSLIMADSALAHFNFVGDSIVGSGVNFEAGSIVANHHNDRDDKTIFIKENGIVVKTDVIKFGALIGDKTRIGANAVLSPGTILPVNSIVKRLELIQQC
jgi:UDP-N-acetylglucosamine diphosphorylase / glucose-1-phosphate thymidylyltransferase / UDP-N-acetylgalactosamine diphosphorylase / glucosamine-1-phosphate N-acetyltransferase / galactosamine-1-phosphate N-acetyltransferase